MNATDNCARSKRVDGLHSWEYDGDDPYIVCVYCRERRDVLTQRVIANGVYYGGPV